ncbi:putative Regulator of G-protein signaling, partial [Penaeus vannamei]
VLHKEMEALVREMQDPETGVPIRSQKWFLTSIPSSFMGYDLIEWLMERLEIEDSVLAPAYLAKGGCAIRPAISEASFRAYIAVCDTNLYKAALSPPIPQPIRQPLPNQTLPSNPPISSPSFNLSFNPSANPPIPPPIGPPIFPRSTNPSPNPPTPPPIC